MYIIVNEGNSPFLAFASLADGRGEKEKMEKYLRMYYLVTDHTFVDFAEAREMALEKREEFDNLTIQVYHCKRVCLECGHFEFDHMQCMKNGELVAPIATGCLECDCEGFK